MNKFLLWTPRILGLAMIIFIALFALDVFGEGYGFWETILALLIHLVPNYILLAVLIVAWKAPRAGGVFYLLLGLAYIIMASNQHWMAYLFISGPLFLIGILFFLQKCWSR